jgi:hypothetical protein
MSANDTTVNDITEMQMTRRHNHIEEPGKPAKTFRPAGASSRENSTDFAPAVSAGYFFMIVLHSAELKQQILLPGFTTMNSILFMSRINPLNACLALLFQLGFPHKFV